MIDNLIGNYIKQMKVEDLLILGKNYGIIASYEDASYILDVVKNNWYILYKGNFTPLLKDIKEHIDPLIYPKVEDLFFTLKKKYNF
ncbi:MAG: DUF2624 family protein [Bacilli bacterium]